MLDDILDITVLMLCIALSMLVGFTVAVYCSRNGLFPSLW